MTTGNEPIAAIAVHAFSTHVQRGKRKSKYDQHISIARGDVVLLHRAESTQAPFVLKINGGVEALAYHPGNFIMSAQHYNRYAVARNRDNQIVYQDRWFVIFTNLRVMQASLIGLIKAGGDVSIHIPLMERIVTSWVQKNADRITEQMEKSWSRYYKLRELWTRPGTQGEGNAARHKGCEVIKSFIITHIAPNVAPVTMEDFS